MWYGNHYQVTKIQTGADSYLFDLQVECANIFDCKIKKLKSDFTVTVMGSTSP